MRRPSCISSVAVGPNWYFSSAVLWWEVVPGLSACHPVTSRHSPGCSLLHFLFLTQSPECCISCDPADSESEKFRDLCEEEDIKTMPVYYHNLSPPPSLGLLLASDWSVRPHSRLWLVTRWLWGVGADTPGTLTLVTPNYYVNVPPSLWPVTIIPSANQRPGWGQTDQWDAGTPGPSHQSIVMCVLVLWRPLDIANQFYERLVLARASHCQIRGLLLPMRVSTGPIEGRQSRHSTGFCAINPQTNSHNFPRSKSQTTKSVTNRSCFVKNSHKCFNFYTFVFSVRSRHIFR